jgi:GNAT superfamily N-acetyltransferase
MMNIRPRAEDDLDGCMACLTRVYEQDRYPVEGVSNTKFNHSTIERAWIAEKDGTIKGHIALKTAMESDVSVALWWQDHPGAKIAVLGSLFVDTDCRGSGVAARLIAEAMAWANERNIRLVLFALEKDRAAARVYERLGWTHFGTSVYHWDQQQMDALCYVSPESD